MLKKIGKTLIWKIKTRKEARTRKGAKGISLLAPYFLEKIRRKMPTIAPSQKASTAAEKIPAIPKSQPRPTASLASPRPIHAPRDKSHIKAKGAETTKPAINEEGSGRWGKKIGAASAFPNKNKPAKARTPKRRTIISGIILCRRS